MKTIAFFVCIFMLSGIPAFPDVLWDRAVEIFDAHSNLLPGRIEVRLTEWGGRNRRLRNEEHGVYRTRSGADGSPEVEIVRVIRNGEDITAERREGDNGGGFSSLFGPPQGSDIPENDDEDGRSGGPGESNPFDPNLQHLLTYSRNGESRLINGRRTTGFTFRQQSEDDPDQFVTGTTWLDSSSGAPLLIESTLDPLPSRLLNTFQFTSHFRESDDGWFLTRLDVDVVAQILLVRREFETTVTFSEHFRSTE